MEEEQKFIRKAAALLFLLMCNAAIQVFFLLVLPSLGRDMGLLPIQTGAILGVAALLAVITAPIWGFFSDRFGRERVLLIGFLAAACGTIIIMMIMASALMNKWPISLLFTALLSVRLVQSLLAGGILPAAQAWMVDNSSVAMRAQAMGLLGAAYGVGAIIGAFCLFILGGKAPLLGLLFLSFLLCLGIIYFWLKMSSLGKGNHIGVAKAAINLQKAYPAFLITFFCITILGFMQHITALRFEDRFAMMRGDALSLAGATMTGASLLMIFSQTLGVKLLKGRAFHLLVIGALLLCFAMVGVTIAQKAHQLIIALQFMGIALGLILPGNLAFLSLITNLGAQGKVAGLNSAAQGLGMALGPFGGAVLYQLSTIAPNILALTFAFFVFVFIVIKIRGLYNGGFSR